MNSFRCKSHSNNVWWVWICTYQNVRVTVLVHTISYTSMHANPVLVHTRSYTSSHKYTHANTHAHSVNKNVCTMHIQQGHHTQTHNYSFIHTNTSINTHKHISQSKPYKTYHPLKKRDISLLQLSLFLAFIHLFLSSPF